MCACDAARSGSLIVKKIDSRLRGNVAAEVACVLAERRKAAYRGERIVAVMAPAFPLHGRTTVNGYQVLEGNPLEGSEMRAGRPTECSLHIPSLFREAGLSAACIDLSRLRSADERLREDTMRTTAETADVLVCDAESEADLHAIASASMCLGRKTVWVGSAGLTRHLPEAAGLVRRAPVPAISRVRGGPVLFVIGSMSHVSEEQAYRLAQHPGIETTHIPAGELLSGVRSSEWTRITAEIQMSLRRGRDTLLKLVGGAKIEAEECRLLTDTLGTMLSPHRGLVGALVASGGETARAVLTGWNVASLQVVAEVEPGLPCSIATVGEFGMPVLTKSGSFGRPESLLNCLEFLHNLERGAGTFGSSVRIV